MAMNNPFPVDGNEFNEKRIVVTGGTRGIGEAIVNRLVRGGGAVIATARTLPARTKRWALRAWSSHDARLVAAMQCYGVPRLLTFNIADFKKLGVTVGDPAAT